MRKLILPLGLLWLFCLMLPNTAQADGIVLISSGSGVYTYGFQITNSLGVVELPAGGTITITGLSGVTGATIGGQMGGPQGLVVVGSTPTTATWGVPSSINSNIHAVNNPNGDLNVDSSVQTLGTVDWTIDTETGVLTGTVLGPVASVPAPEPSSVTLMLLGVGLVFGLRKRNSRGHELAT